MLLVRVSCAEWTQERAAYDVALNLGSAFPDEFEAGVSPKPLHGQVFHQTHTA